MLTHTHKKLAAALEVMIGGEGSLSLRLHFVAKNLVSLSPGDFDDHRLRSQFRSLRDDLILMGLFGDGPDGPVTNVEPQAAMTLAVRLMEVCFYAARAES